MAVIHGGKMIVYLGGVAIAGAKSCDITTQADTIEKSSSTQGTAKEYLAGRTGWKITSSFLVIDNNAKTMLQKKGTSVVVTVQTTGVSDSTLYGNAIVTSCHVTATKGNLSNGSIELLGNGELQNSVPGA